MYFNVVRPGRMETDVFFYFLAIHFTCFLSHFSECLFCRLEIYCVYLVQNGLWERKHQPSKWMFFALAQIQLIRSIYLQINEITALQRALVMMEFSDRSLLVSVTDLIWILTVELQSEQNANVFHVSDSFWTVGFGVYLTANLKMFSKISVLHTT